jgi:aquaporin Z
VVNVRALVTELIGTFFLVFTIGMTVINPSEYMQDMTPDPGVPALVPLAIGSVLMVMIFAGGHISGAHYNPAVTLGVLLRGKIEIASAAGYWVAQIVGAALAWLAVTALKPAMPPSPRLPTLNTGPALLAEFLFTFALVYVVLNVATARETDGNSYFGLAIGFTVMAGAFAVGGVSGGAFNPAVAVGASLMNIFAWGNFWIYLVAELAAGVAAAVAFKFLHADREVVVVS